MDGKIYKKLIYVIDDYFEKEPIVIYWANGLVIKCKSFSGMYETDTEPSDEDYIGEYAAAVNEIEILEKGRDNSIRFYNNSIEISLVNIPHKITLEDGTVLWEQAAISPQ